MKRLITMFLVLFCLISLVAASPAVAQDLKTNLDLQMIIAPTTGAADITSAAINSNKYKAQLLGIYSTANASWSADANVAFIMTHSASSTANFAAVEQKDVVGATVNASGTIYTLNAATTSDTMAKVMYIGRMPYIKIQADFTGALNVATPTVAVYSVQGGKIFGQ